jgi:hypothetical protein
MAAGVRDRLWSVEDLVELWEAYEQRRAERAAYGEIMVKIILCVDCGHCIKIEGSIEGLRQIIFSINCPYCETPNEIQWPMAGDYTVGPCDKDESSK